jgi:hypothetical protein
MLSVCVLRLAIQRAANDPRGGWLFGLAFGFVLWMLVPIPLLQWLPHRPILSGNPLSAAACATALGTFVGGRVSVRSPTTAFRLEDRERANRGRFGREAVTRPLLARLGTR